MTKDEFITFTVTLLGDPSNIFHAIKPNAPLGVVLVESTLSCLKNYNTFVTFLVSQ